MSELRSYLVEGFVSRDRLRDDERRGVRRTAAGAWVRVGVFRTWGPRSAIEKALRQGWSRDERASKYRATLIPEKKRKLAEDRAEQQTGSKGVRAASRSRARG